MLRTGPRSLTWYRKSFRVLRAAKGLPCVSEPSLLPSTFSVYFIFLDVLQVHPGSAALTWSSDVCGTAHNPQVTENLLPGSHLAKPTCEPAEASHSPAQPRLSRLTAGSGMWESEPLAAGTASSPPALPSYSPNSEAGNMSVTRSHVSLM